MIENTFVGSSPACPDTAESRARPTREPRSIPCREREPDLMECLLGQVATTLLVHEFPFNAGTVYRADPRETRTAAHQVAIDEIPSAVGHLERKGWFKAHHVTALLYGHAVVLGEGVKSCWGLRVPAEQLVRANLPDPGTRLTIRGVISQRLAETFGSRNFYCVGIAPLADRDDYLVHGLNASCHLDQDVCLRSLARLLGQPTGEATLGTWAELECAMKCYLESSGSEDDMLGLGGMYGSPLVMRKARKLYEEDSQMLCDLHEAKFDQTPVEAAA